MNISSQTNSSVPATYMTMSAAQVDSLMAGPARLLASITSTLRSLFTGRSTPKSDIELVREMADSYARTDPSYASDLYAAADRAERAQLGEG